MHARRVDQNDLSLRAIDDTDDFEARRLGFVRDRGDFFTDESIEQG